MAIDAIVANMDHVWSAIHDGQDSETTNEQRTAIKHLLQRFRDDGYPLLLMSEMDAGHLNSAISSTLGQDGVMYFSAILSSKPGAERYAVALHTLETPPYRVMALSSSERELQEARSFGIARCLYLEDALNCIPI
ncbi:hypothetical protein P5W99_38100 [Paraburkholderia sp. A3BS-1L]|uniref:hypothetical protein n=1 Tax=Paraburkholderia sp. A3BS-1L TaxID=3028375 RepID=UPI003DA8E7D7